MSKIFQPFYFREIPATNNLATKNCQRLVLCHKLGFGGLSNELLIALFKINNTIHYKLI